MNRSLIISGTSSGIGKACVKSLDERGFKIFAAVRNIKDYKKIKSETSKNIIPLLLDLGDEKTIRSAYSVVSENVGESGLYGLVNNAAIAIGGPMEFMPLKDIRRQFEINLFGQIAMIQTFLPLLRKGGGRIINISSTNGWISFPFMGIYCATKYALEAISDALRLELQKWSIPVSVINPNKIISPIWEKSIEITNRLFNGLPGDARSYYDTVLSGVIKTIRKTADTALSPDIIVEAVYHALTAKRPKTSYLPSFETKILFLISRILPKKILNIMIKKEMGMRF
jgi:short-subunit dehydrogenase